MSKEIIVARVCLECGKLILSSYRHYCSNECSSKDKRNVSKKYRERYNLSKWFLFRNHIKQIHDQKIEELGTYATATTFKQYVDCKLVRDKDGTPNFEKELQVVRYLKDKTFNGRYVKNIYTITEGDIIRNDVHKE